MSASQLAFGKAVRHDHDDLVAVTVQRLLAAPRVNRAHREVAMVLERDQHRDQDGFAEYGASASVMPEWAASTNFVFGKAPTVPAGSYRAAEQRSD
jgi:hypothetical protein